MPSAYPGYASVDTVNRAPGEIHTNAPATIAAGRPSNRPASTPTSTEATAQITMNSTLRATTLPPTSGVSGANTYDSSTAVYTAPWITIGRSPSRIS